MYKKIQKCVTKICGKIDEKYIKIHKIKCQTLQRFNSAEYSKSTQESTKIPSFSDGVIFPFPLRPNRTILPFAKKVPKPFSTAAKKYCKIYKNVNPFLTKISRKKKWKKPMKIQ